MPTPSREEIIEELKSRIEVYKGTLKEDNMDIRTPGFNQLFGAKVELESLLEWVEDNE